MANAESIIEKIKTVINADMLNAEMKATGYASGKLIKEGLSAAEIAKNLRKMPDFSNEFEVKLNKDIAALSLSDDDYIAVVSAGFSIVAEKSHALEDIACVIADTFSRTESFAMSAAIRDIFGGDAAYWPVANKAWNIAVSVADGSDNISKARVIETYLDILSVMRDAKNVALQGVCMKAADSF